jgi:hypothetical protein
MKKYWLCLFSVLLSFFLSCTGDVEEIKIEWVILRDISDALKNNESPVTIEFLNSKKDIEIHLKPDITKKIKKQKDMRLFSTGGHGSFLVYIYPDGNNDFLKGIKEEDRFKRYGAMEIFLYNIWLVEENEHSITVLPNEKALVYTHTIFRDNRMFYFYSLNNCININTEEVFRIDAGEAASLEKVLGIMKENNIDACYLTESISSFPSDRLLDYSGFFVNSRLSEDGVVFLYKEWGFIM